MKVYRKVRREPIVVIQTRENFWTINVTNDFLNLIMNLTDDLSVWVWNRCGPHVFLCSAVTFELSSALPATDTLRGAIQAFQEGWPSRMHLPQLYVCVHACLWCRDYIVLPLHTLQHWNNINNSTAHCRAQCCTENSFFSHSLPLDSSVFFWLLLDYFYAPILFLLPPPPDLLVLPTLCVSVFFQVSTTTRIC